ncbi:MAG TPA: type 1 glutamine amidotransferase, partial [Baekduia sp.]|uniref:type 1 glutamine amidotransferase n=1 Tax=Baekduia sp. TaxID=2600305 RepID=UPI002D78CCCA
EVWDATTGSLPALDGAGFVVSLGAEESARDERLPWVAAEVELLRAAIAAELPVLGVCFGGQALSIALGGDVDHAERPQIGWLAIDGDELEHGPWFHWHYEQLSVPPGAQLLARSPVGPAAFRAGRHLGMQFHPEVTTAVIADWVRSSSRLRELGIDADELLAESERRSPAARAAAWLLFDEWWALATGRPERARGCRRSASAPSPAP